MIVNIINSWLHVIYLHSVQTSRVTQVAQENGQDGYQKPFSTQFFNDTQAYWWARKAVQIIPVGGSKFMNI